MSLNVCRPAMEMNKLIKVRILSQGFQISIRSLSYIRTRNICYVVLKVCVCVRTSGIMM
jgi:hypothetical protein